MNVSPFQHMTCYYVDLGNCHLSLKPNQHWVRCEIPICLKLWSTKFKDCSISFCIALQRGRSCLHFPAMLRNKDLMYDLIWDWDAKINATSVCCCNCLMYDLIVYTPSRKTINGHCRNHCHILIYICILCRLIPILYL